MKLLITGAQGQLGLALTRRLSRDHAVIALTREHLDIADARACMDALKRERPDVLLNCAAHTAVDKAESADERDQVFRVNTEGPRQLARACNALGVTPIHFSTDYVFDGTKRSPYVESDQTNPQSVYGESKLQGELAVSSECADPMIIRLSWVYSNDGANFFRTMLRLAADRPQLRVVADQFGVPNYAADIADAIYRLLDRRKAELTAHSGLYHLSAPGMASWCDFARAIMAGAGLQDRVTVEAITTSDYPTAAVRPAYSVLNSSRFAATFGVTMPSWQDALHRCLTHRAEST